MGYKCFNVLFSTVLCNWKKENACEKTKFWVFRFGIEHFLQAQQYFLRPWIHWIHLHYCEIRKWNINSFLNQILYIGLSVSSQKHIIYEHPMTTREPLNISTSHCFIHVIQSSESTDVLMWTVQWRTSLLRGRDA